MLNLVTGVPGASKTAFVVTELDQVERKNKINLAKNKVIYQHNQPLIEKFAHDFSYIEVEIGSGHELKRVTEFLPDDYFSFLGQDFDDLRPDYYFARSVQFNEIIDRIHDRDGNQGFQIFHPVRTIYTNIKALKIDYVRANVYDWRKCPDGSIIVIDEVQLVEPYSDTKKKDDIVQELTIHRHRGFDFYFITQSVSLLHPTIKELISVHFHITRPYGRTPKIYRFGSCRPYPNTLVNKLNCEAKFNFKVNPRIFKLYKSTSINTAQKRLPGGLIGFACFIIFGLFIFSYGASGGSGFLGHFFGKEKTYDVQKKPAPSPDPTGQQTSTPQNQTSTTLPTQSAQVQQIVYDPNKPFETQFAPGGSSQAQLSGCMQIKKRCSCFTQQGTKLDVSASDCKKIMTEGLPFNPFKQQSPGQTSPGATQIPVLQAAAEQKPALAAPTDDIKRVVNLTPSV